MENRRIIEKPTKLKVGFLKRSTNMMNFQLDRPIIKEKTPISKVRSERGGITTDLRERKRILRERYKRLHDNILYNLDEISKFLERYKLSKLNQEETA